MKDNFFWGEKNNMEKKIVMANGFCIAIIQSDELVIVDTQSALDLLATLDYYDNCQRIALYKETIIEDSFTLSTGIAGDILQKFSTYSKKLAIIGDFSMYSSKPLKSFMSECNRGPQIFFVANEEEAIKKLSVVCSQREPDAWIKVLRDPGNAESTVRRITDNGILVEIVPH